MAGLDFFYLIVLKFYITQALRNMKREIGIFTEAAQL